MRLEQLQVEDGNVYLEERPVGHIRDLRIVQALRQPRLSPSERRQAVFAAQMALEGIPGWETALRRLLAALDGLEELEAARRGVGL